MKRLIPVLVLTLAVGVTVWSNSGGPPDGKTGAPGEGICTDCHNSFPLNSGDGSLGLSGLPDYYQPSTTYTLTVNLQDPGQVRWGFELSAKDENNQQAGTFTVTDAVNTQSSSSGGITYIKHTSTGTFNGFPDGPVSWTFDWTSPSGKYPGRIFFYVAGNAANGADGNQGDYIYRIVRRTEKLTDQVPSTQFIGKMVLVLLLLAAAVFVLAKRRLIFGQT
jgi:hypothetical protein